jgi:four helix bundle protein
MEGCAMRDHTRLRAFREADRLVQSVYRATAPFPKLEQFGLTSQLRRAAVSVATNIVEGCARSTESEYLRFLDIAYGSAKELEYQLGLSETLGFLDRQIAEQIKTECALTAKLLCRLILALRRENP